MIRQGVESLKKVVGGEDRNSAQLGYLLEK